MEQMVASTILAGKAALVTGGTSGIGEAAVERLVRDGARVAFTGTDAARGAAVAAHTGALFIRHDVSDETAWPDVIAQIETAFGRLDIAFANAGISAGDASIDKVDVAGWRRIMDVNVTGVMLSCQHAISLMRRNPGGSSGSIIINSSVVAMQSLPDYLAYTTSKGALRSMTKGIASYCARERFNIRCNSIHPGNTETPNMTRAADASGNRDAALAYLGSFSPLGRMASAAEIADVVAYLAGDGCPFLTGAEILIDGATIAGMGSV